MVHCLNNANEVTELHRKNLPVKKILGAPDTEIEETRNFLRSKPSFKRT